MVCVEAWRLQIDRIADLLQRKEYLWKETFLVEIGIYFANGHAHRLPGGGADFGVRDREYGLVSLDVFLGRFPEYVMNVFHIGFPLFSIFFRLDGSIDQRFFSFLNSMQSFLADRPAVYALIVVITIVVEGLLLVGLMGIFLKLISRSRSKY